MLALDPRHLRVLLAVDRCGSFTSAAETLGMSQPAVSMAIAQLEDWAGLQVVSRDRKGAVLTDAGRHLVRRAKAMENLLEQARAELDGCRNDQEGPLRVAGTPGALLALLPRILGVIRESRKPFQVQSLEALDEHILPKLRDREVDLALCTGGRQAPPGDIIEEILVSEPFLLLAPPQLDLPTSGMTVAEAAAHPWVLPLEAGATRKQLEAVFLSSGVSLPQTIVRCDALATMKELVRHAGFLSLLPASVAATELDAGLICSVPLLDGPPPRQLAVWRLASDDPSPLTTAFIEAARRAFPDP
ncbi:LysR family transcriptional regulator [Celeribacter sp. ULVN23_4]